MDKSISLYLEMLYNPLANRADSDQTAPRGAVWSQSPLFAPGVQFEYLTLKAPITTAADDIYKYFFIVFQRK